MEKPINRKTISSDSPFLLFDLRAKVAAPFTCRPTVLGFSDRLDWRDVGILPLRH
jgi:hypothetical protein